MASTPLIKKRLAEPFFLWLIVLIIFLGILSLIIVKTFSNGLVDRRISHNKITPAAVRTKIQINQQVISAEVVTTAAAMYQGLSNREMLCPACGLLFVFDNQQERKFVMRNMKIPLDIIFINQGRIIKISDNLPPEGQTPQIIYKSGGPADQVLELNGGYAEKQGIKVGDEVLIFP
ncbi:MAG: DUF192 domain-containing protein [Patescibacteria group bacterium]|jgi:hypothetical protein